MSLYFAKAFLQLEVGLSNGRDHLIKRFTDVQAEAQMSVLSQRQPVLIVPKSLCSSHINAIPERDSTMELSFLHLALHTSCLLRLK